MNGVALALVAVLAAKPYFATGFAALQAAPRYCCGPATLAGAKPVAKAYRGPLDGVDVAGQSATVLVRFGQADRAQAEAALTQVTKAQGLAQGTLVSFVRTEAGPLTGITLALSTARMPFGKYSSLAAKLSERPEVAETWAVLAPGPRDDSLEQEAVFHFEDGKLVDESRVQYRDEAAYLDMVQRGASASKFHASRWPSFPLSQLAQKLQLPGRACLDAPWQLQTLASLRWPIDAGENLTLSWVDLPGGLAAEILQQGLRQKRSPSSLVAEALVAARDAKALADRPEVAQAPYDEGQPDAEKQARRTLTLFLPEAVLDVAEDKGSAEAVSISRVVQYAWRRLHPHEAPR